MGASPVFAQEEEATQTEEDGQASHDQEARSLFEAANLAFADGRYDDALSYFRRAYELSRRPEMLFNIGTTAERLRRDEEAIAAYERFLAEQPDNERSRETEARIIILRNSMGASDEAEVPAIAVDMPDAERNFTWAWVSGVAAVVFIGMGAAGRIAGNNAYDDLLTRCTAGCSDEVVNDSSVATWDRLTVASFGLGALALVGTVLGVVIAPKRLSDAEVQIGPANISVQGRF